MFENSSYDVDNELTEYMCDTTGWIKYTATDIIGRCDSTKAGTYTIYHGRHYECTTYGKWYQNLPNPRHADTVMYSCNKPEDAFSIVIGLDSTFVTCTYSSTSGSYGSSRGHFYKCNQENEGMDTTYAEKPIYCNGDGYWHKVFEGLEKCTTKNYGAITKSAQYGKVICDDIGWRSVERYEELLGICSAQNDDVLVENGDE